MRKRFQDFPKFERSGSAGRWKLTRNPVTVGGGVPRRARDASRVGAAAGLAGLEDLLGGQPYFQGLSLVELRLLVRMAVETCPGRGELIFEDTIPGCRFWLILSGRVDLELETGGGRSILIRSLNAATEPGLSWLIEPCYSWIRARAVTATRVVLFDETALSRLSDMAPGPAAEIKRRITQAVIESLKVTQQCLLAAAKR